MVSAIQLRILQLINNFGSNNHDFASLDGILGDVRRRPGL